MAGLVSGTWALISSSANLISGTRQMTERTRQMTERVQRMLNTHDQYGTVSAQDSKQLCALQQRVECLVQPLNYLLLWSSGSNTAVQQVVTNAHQLLLSVCEFITKATKGSSAAMSPDKLQREFQHYFRELDFMVQAVQLAISVSQIQNTSAKSQSTISPSALIKASHRVAEMYNKGGDMCVCEGKLVWRLVGSEEPWELYYMEECRMKVISDLAKMSKACFSLRVDRIFVDGDRGSDEGAIARGDAICFSINSATGMRLESAATLPEATAVASGEESVGWLDGQSVLIWTGTPASATLDPEFDSILLETSSNTLSPRDSRVGGECTDSEFAFYFKERRLGDATFSPVDFLYVAKLCALDDHAGGTSTATPGGTPPHLKAADEVLQEILMPPRPVA